jgi:hypothetical protein
MDQRIETLPDVWPRAKPQIGAPPLPHEHGAWVMLYAPMILAAAALWPAPALPVFCLFFATSGAYLARHAAALWLRRSRRGNGRAPKENLEFWLGVYSLVMSVGGAPLFLVYGRWELLKIAGAAALLFGLHSALQLWPSRKRLDRSLWGEVFGSGVLALTGPATLVAAGGALDRLAFCLWTVCALYFAGGVFRVKMLLAAAKIKGEFTTRDRFGAAVPSLIFHMLLLAALWFFTVKIGGQAALFAWVAFAPSIIGALTGVCILSNRLPKLTRVGILETVYSVWFVAWFAAALRM